MAPQQEHEALERKLRPLYDALDARNWKGALKLADAALKKHKNNQLVRALKSFALIKSGKAAEALQICAELVAEGPAEEQVLSTMVFTYKAANRLADITPAYLAAVERAPGNAELLHGLFAAYVRDANFVKQQQTAARLVKAAASGALPPPQQPQEGGGGASSKEGGAGKYTWWAVCSLVLQARAALRGQPSSLPADKLLALAEGMAARQAGAGGAPGSYEALLLYLDILHGQGKHAQALQVVDGAGAAVVPLEADRAHLRAAALARAGDLPAAAAAYRALALANPDDWAYWALYLDCALPGSCEAAGAPALRFPVGVVGGLAELWDRQHPWRDAHPAQDPATCEAAWQEVQQSLGELQAAVQSQEAWREQASKGILRGPLLAPLEAALRRLRLARRLQEQQQQQQQWDAGAAERAVAEEVLQAYRRTASNTSCAADLRSGLQAVTDPSLRRWLASEVHAAAAELAAAGAVPSEESAAAGSEQSEQGSMQSGTRPSNGSQGAELRTFQARVSAYQVEYDLGLPEFGAPGEAQEHAAAVLSCYQAHLHISAPADEKERGYGEDLVCIAAAALLRAAQLEAAPQQAGRRLLEAVLVLEAAQVQRKVSAPLRLAATALYSLAGAPRQASASLSALDVKYILHDTLTGHWLLPALVGGAAEAADLRKWLGGVSFLHEEHAREAADTLMLAYYGGTYSKVVEFEDFRERLAASHTRALGRAEEAALRLRTAAAAGGPVATPLLLAALEMTATLQDPAPRAGLLDGAGLRASAGALRYNEDLSTRPPWLPPHTGPCRLGVAEWWAVWQQVPCQGYPQQWWAAPAAGDSSSAAPAAAWRQQQLGALRQRWLLPGLLSAALASTPTPAEAAMLGARLRQLAAAQGALAESGAGVDDTAWQAQLDTWLAELAERSNGSAGSSAAAAELVQGVSLALFAAAHAVHAALLAGRGDASAVAAAVMAARLGWLQGLLTALCRLVAGSLEAPGRLGALPLGGGTCLASALLGEEGMWVAACLQAWAKLARAGGSGKKAAAAAEEGAAGQLRAGIQALAAAAAQGAAAVQAALDTLAASPLQQQAREIAGALDAAGAPGDAPPSTLWDFEPAFNLLEAVQKMVADQRDVVVRLQGAAKALLAALSSVPV